MKRHALSLVFGITFAPLVLATNPPAKKAPTAGKRVTGQAQPAPSSATQLPTSDEQPTNRQLTKKMKKLFAMCEPFADTETLILQGYADDPEESLNSLKQILAKRIQQAERDRSAWLQEAMRQFRAGNRVSSDQAFANRDACEKKRDSLLADYNRINPKTLQEVISEIRSLQ